MIELKLNLSLPFTVDFPWPKTYFSSAYMLVGILAGGQCEKLCHKAVKNFLKGHGQTNESEDLNISQ